MGHRFRNTIVPITGPERRQFARPCLLASAGKGAPAGVRRMKRSLTEEERNRIENNRLRALLLRAGKDVRASAEPVTPPSSNSPSSDSAGSGGARSAAAAAALAGLGGSGGASRTFVAWPSQAAAAESCVEGPAASGEPMPIPTGADAEAAPPVAPVASRAASPCCGHSMYMLLAYPGIVLSRALRPVVPFAGQRAG